jgi:hypothetical protein
MIKSFIPTAVIIVGCLLLGVAIPSIPYINLQKELVLTAVYFSLTVFAIIKYQHVAHYFLAIFAGLAMFLTILQAHLIAEVVGNVFFLTLLVFVISKLVRLRNEN